MFTESSKPQTFVDSPTRRVSVSSDAPRPLDSAARHEDVSEESLLEIVEELTEIGALDEQSKRELLADLRAAKPENWSMIVQQYRMALAYQKQLAKREGKTRQGFEALESNVDALAEESSPQSPRMLRRDRDRREARLSAESNHEASMQRTPRPAIEPEDEPEAERPQPQAVVLSKPPRQVIKQASYQSREVSPLDWKEQLDSAVADMQAALPEEPVSTDEVNEHMRLRLLQLLAGNQEAALQPVPGATAPQQDYWSQQLFAVSTFLDSQSQPDNKRRATGSLTYLDQARTKLAELATLQVRNLTFVDSVDGYGDYAMREQASFKPGDSVTLYAEIENFTSESTKKGHRTRLGTSFEILDKNGKRVDSAQFPEVEDLCKTPRRDFHMQYTVTLPTRIYADNYEIRLIVTDEQSHKIGQASLPLEIAE